MGISNNPQFEEIVKIPGRLPVRFLTPEALSGLEGRRARVHGHSPAMEHLGFPVYSVIVGGRVVGQTKNIHLDKSTTYVHQRLLREALETGKKTANTFVVGNVSPAPTELPERPLKIRPGTFTDVNTGKDASGSLGEVWLGPEGARYRK